MEVQVKSGKNLREILLLSKRKICFFRQSDSIFIFYYESRISSAVP